ncbi:MAG: hypothetical protein QOI65_823 [Thermoleophilaceae bacterium]|nr:hypothetical protein [Thermoleophilaceae bacterium]
MTGEVRTLYVGTLPPHQGGSAMVAGQVLPGLAALGHRIEAIAPITESALGAGDPFAAREPEVELSRFVMPYLDSAPDTPPSESYRRQEREEIERLVALGIEAGPPDVLLIGRESFAPHVVGLAREHSIPTVLLVAGATTMGILNGSYPPPLAARLLDCCREVDVSVTSAQHMRTTLGELGVPDVEVIPNPVDLERFRPATRTPAMDAELDLTGGDVVVAHISNLKSIKRPLDLVDAAEIALGQNDRLVFVVLGDGPCRGAVEERAAALGVRTAFRFPGWVEHARVPEFINATDIVVMPSAGEAQALVYLETAACERTLIASDIPAAREVIDDRENGLLFPTGDVPALARAILVAAGDPTLRAELGRRARRSVARHSLDQVVAAYARLLESLARGQAARGSS